MNVLACLSGGVDSAVAAARARDDGHDVVAVHLALAGGADGGCCTPQDARDASRVADALDVPYYVWDLSERFTEQVVEPFLAGYAEGVTPNPCMACNERIKFAAVLERGRALGFERVVTGHYARLRDGALLRAVDQAKDQSYVLGLLRPDQLAGAMFPLGGSTKDEVRAEAAARGLAVAAKPDSHDVCFAPRGTSTAWLTDRLGARPGRVLDASGAVLGRHDGTYGYTVGQRRGIRLDRPAADGAPRYVLGIDPVARTVTVGTAQELLIDEVGTGEARWAGPAPRLPLQCTVQLRAHGAPLEALVREDGAGLCIELVEPTRAVAAGQAAVLYDGDTVLGGGQVRACRKADR